MKLKKNIFSGPASLGQIGAVTNKKNVVIVIAIKNENMKLTCGCNG
jgi:hypothetical protein